MICIKEATSKKDIKTFVKFPSFCIIKLQTSLIFHGKILTLLIQLLIQKFHEFSIKICSNQSMQVSLFLFVCMVFHHKSKSLSANEKKFGIQDREFEICENNVVLCIILFIVKQAFGLFIYYQIIIYKNTKYNKCFVFLIF